MGAEQSGKRGSGVLELERGQAEELPTLLCKKHPGTSNDQQAVRSRLSQLTSRQEMIYNTKGEVKALPEQSVRSTH